MSATPESRMYPAETPYRVLELVAFRTQGRVVFATPEEYAGTKRAGRPRWRGLVATTTDQVGCAFEPGIPEDVTNAPSYEDACERVRREGRPYNGA